MAWKTRPVASNSLLTSAKGGRRATVEFRARSARLVGKRHRRAAVAWQTVEAWTSRSVRLHQYPGSSGSGQRHIPATVISLSASLARQDSLASIAEDRSSSITTEAHSAVKASGDWSTSRVGSRGGSGTTDSNAPRRSLHPSAWKLALPATGIVEGQIWQRPESGHAWPGGSELATDGLEKCPAIVTPAGPRPLERREWPGVSPAGGATTSAKGLSVSDTSVFRAVSQPRFQEANLADRLAAGIGLRRGQAPRQAAHQGGPWGNTYLEWTPIR